jgi:hypothetical protein
MVRWWCLHKRFAFRNGGSSGCAGEKEWAGYGRIRGGLGILWRRRGWKLLSFPSSTNSEHALKPPPDLARHFIDTCEQSAD